MMDRPNDGVKSIESAAGRCLRGERRMALGRSVGRRCCGSVAGLLVSAALMLVSGAVTPAAQELPSPDEVLQRSDEAYLPQSAKLRLRIETYEDGAREYWELLDVRMGGPGEYLAVSLEPRPARGQAQLRLDETIYHYVRNVDRMRQRSAREAFRATNLNQEDVMSQLLSQFYTAERVERSTAADGRESYVLHLEARSRRVAYGSIEAEVDAETYLPIRRRYYTHGGDPIQDLVIDEIRTEKGEVSYVEFRMIDLLQDDLYTVVTMEEIDPDAEMPDHFFTQQYMRRAVR